MSVLDTMRRWSARLHAFDEDLTELYARRALLDRPWEEEFLHWAYDGEQWQLHGTLTPPPGVRRRHSVTRRGWCPGLARRRA